jgi:hypothetical protein
MSTENVPVEASETTEPTKTTLEVGVDLGIKSFSSCSSTLSRNTQFDCSLQI